MFLVGIDSCPGGCDGDLEFRRLDLETEALRLSSSGLKHAWRPEWPSTALLKVNDEILFARLRGRPVVCTSEDRALVSWDHSGDLGVAIVDSKGGIEPRPVIALPTRSPRFPTCGFSSEIFHLVGLAYDQGRGIVSLMRVSRDGFAIDAVPRALHDSDLGFPSLDEIAIASRSVSSLVVWNENVRQCGKGCLLENVRSTVILRGGISTPALWFSASENDQYSPNVIEHGNGWVVAWLEDDRNPGQQAVRVRKANTIGMPVGEAVAPELGSSPVLVNMGENVLVISDESRFPYVVLDGSSLEVVARGELLEEGEDSGMWAAFVKGRLWMVWRHQFWRAPWAGASQVLGMKLDLAIPGM